MNKQSKDGSISWTDYTWNPIKGICPVDCKLPDGRSYCYARAMYKRFKMNPKIRCVIGELRPSVIYTDIKFLHRLKPGMKVFVCSAFEIFHPAVKKEWRDLIFEIIEMNPKLIFQILTKMPENIDRPMPGNVWLGVSVINRRGYMFKISKLLTVKAKIHFVSIEPMLQSLSLVGRYYNYLEGWDIFSEHDPIRKLNWVIIGRLTGHGKKHDPEREWIERIIQDCRQNNTPVFLKNNLKEIWGEKLIKEFPG